MHTRALAALLLFAACQTQPSPPAPDKHPSPAPVASAPSTEKAAPVEGAKPATNKPKKGSGTVDREKRETTPDEDKALKAYRAAMKEGREKTRAKSYSEAIAAFDRAIAAMPDNTARAISERGYAKLLGEQLDAASADLDQAASLTTDHKLLGQIWYNRGLIAEKQGRPEDATRAFVTSNQFNPSKAAEKKIAGASSCAIEVERPAQAPKAAANWRAVAAILKASDYGMDDKTFSTDAEAKEYLCRGSSCPGKGPYLVDGELTQAIAIPQADGSFWVHDDFEGLTFARCGQYGGVLSLVSASPLHVKQTFSIPGAPGYDCFDAEGKSLGEDADPSQDGVDCVSFCMEEGEESSSHLFFDERGTLTLKLSYHEGEGYTVSQSGASVTVKGKSCADTLRLP